MVPGRRHLLAKAIAGGRRRALDIGAAGGGNTRVLRRARLAGGGSRVRPRLRRRGRDGRGLATSAVTRPGSRSPTTRSTSSWPSTCSSTSRTTTQRSPRCGACQADRHVPRGRAGGPAALVESRRGGRPRAPVHARGPARPARPQRVHGHRRAFVERAAAPGRGDAASDELGLRPRRPHPAVNLGLRAIITAERYLPVGSLPGVSLLVRAQPRSPQCEVRPGSGAAVSRGAVSRGAAVSTGGGRLDGSVGLGFRRIVAPVGWAGSGVLGRPCDPVSVVNES